MNVQVSFLSKACDMEWYCELCDVTRLSISFKYFAFPFDVRTSQSFSQHMSSAIPLYVEASPRIGFVMTTPKDVTGAGGSF